MTRRPPISTRTDTRYPYTTRFLARVRSRSSCKSRKTEKTAKTGVRVDFPDWWPRSPEFSAACRSSSGLPSAPVVPRSPGGTTCSGPLGTRGGDCSLWCFGVQAVSPTVWLPTLWEQAMKKLLIAGALVAIAFSGSAFADDDDDDRGREARKEYQEARREALKDHRAAIREDRKSVV